MIKKLRPKAYNSSCPVLLPLVASSKLSPSVAPLGSSDYFEEIYMSKWKEFIAVKAFPFYPLLLFFNQIKIWEN